MRKITKYFLLSPKFLAPGPLNEQVRLAEICLDNDLDSDYTVQGPSEVRPGSSGAVRWKVHPSCIAWWFLLIHLAGDIPEIYHIIYIYTSYIYIYIYNLLTRMHPQVKNGDLFMRKRSRNDMKCWDCPFCAMFD